MKKFKKNIIVIALIIFIILITYNTRNIEEINYKIPILMFHSISDTATDDEKWTISTEIFESEIKYLKENNYNTIFLEDINKKQKNTKNIVLTFDDGYEDFYTNVFPLLKKYNMKANLYITTDYINGNNFLKEEQLKEIAKSKLVSIGSHTCSHQSLVGLNNELLDKELFQSKNIIENMLNIKINTVAYPYGHYDDTTKGAAQKYYEYALAIDYEIQDMSNYDKYGIKRVAILGTDSIEDFKTKITPS